MARPDAPQERVWRVATMSDYVPLRLLKRREVYDSVYRPIKIDHFLAITVGANAHRRAVLLLDRDRSEFTDEERVLAQTLIVPLANLEHIYDKLGVRSRTAAAMLVFGGTAA